VRGEGSFGHRISSSCELLGGRSFERTTVMGL